MEKIFRYFRNFFQTNASPRSMALGFAVGTLIAILPTPGFGIFIGLFLAILFKKINKIGVVAAFSVWNPLMLVPTYWISYLLGDLVFQPDPKTKFDLELIDQMYHYSGKFLVGNCFIAIITASFSYYAVLHLISAYKEKKSLRKVLHFYRLNHFLKLK